MAGWREVAAGEQAASCQALPADTHASFDHGTPWKVPRWRGLRSMEGERGVLLPQVRPRSSDQGGGGGRRECCLHLEGRGDGLWALGCGRRKHTDGI